MHSPVSSTQIFIRRLPSCGLKVCLQAELFLGISFIPRFSVWKGFAVLPDVAVKTKMVENQILAIQPAAISFTN
jgi:hypothetical protein